MFEQDYIMRLVKELVRTVLKLLFNIDTEAPTTELLEDQADKEVLDSLLDMVDAGSINQAENKLYDLLSPENMTGLEIALLFYSYLNDKEDHFLEEHDFSRDEIKTGLRTVITQYGLNSIAEMFLTEF